MGETNSAVTGIAGLLYFSLMNPAHAGVGSDFRKVAAMFAEKEAPIACSTFTEFEEYNNVYGLLINGDRHELRHLGNVTQAKSTLERLGVSPENITIVNQANVSISGRDKDEYDAQFSENQVYPSNGEGVKEAAAYLREHVKKNDLVIVYTTGHGLNNCLSLNHGCYTVDNFLGELSFMKEREVEGIFISDQCYSGSIPKKAVDAGFKVKHAFAPIVEETETQCQLFIPYVWQAIEHCIDVNNDGKTTFLDSALFANAHYHIAEEYQGLSYQGSSKSSLKFNKKDMSKTMTNVFLSEVGLVGEQYHQRFSMEDIAHLTTGFVAPWQANIFPRRFNGADIGALVTEGITPEVAQTYAKRFNGEDIVALIKAEIPTLIAEQYNQRFRGKDIAALYKTNLDQSKALEYEGRFTGEDILVLVREDIAPQNAKKYAARFNGKDIVELIAAGISSEIAEQYEKRAQVSFIIPFVEAGIEPEIVLRYEERFRYQLTSDAKESREIRPLLIKVVEENIPVEDLNKYSSRFDGEDVFRLVTHNVPNEEAIKYDIRFSGFDIQKLVENDISAEEAERYDERFDGNEIVSLMKARVSADRANQYTKNVKVREIIKESKVEETEEEKENKMAKIKECGSITAGLALLSGFFYGISRMRKKQ